MKVDALQKTQARALPRRRTRLALAALAALARPLLSGALDRVSLAVTDGSTVTYAGFRADEHTQYEIGSLTKTFTAMLLADAIERGEVTAGSPIGAQLTLRTRQPEFFAELSLAGWRCDAGTALSATEHAQRVAVHGEAGTVVLTPVD